MMDTIVYYICIPLGYLMKWCWMLVENYGLAIILFTLATKIVLLPVSVWIQKGIQYHEKSYFYHSLPYVGSEHERYRFC